MVKVDKKRVNSFIVKANECILRGQYKFNQYEDGLPFLNDTSFQKVKKLAEDAGYIISRYENNDQNTSYKIEHL